MCYGKSVGHIIILTVCVSLFPYLEITHRFQTARAEVRELLLQCLLPWLENMELVAASVPPATPLSYIMVSRINALLCMYLHIFQ